MGWRAVPESPTTIKLCELIEDTTPTALWPLVTQCGVDGVVAIMNGAEQQGRWLNADGVTQPEAQSGPAPWSRRGLHAMIERFAARELTVAVIEDTPPMDAIRLGQPDSPRQLEQVHEQITAMGELGIPVLCYNWMAIGSWARTDVAVPTRGGALTTGFRRADSEALGALTVPAGLDHSRLWDTLHGFLDATLPVAEAAGVRLALHPDDPPLSVSRGVPRIVSSVAAYRTIIDSHPSPSNKITFCQGNWALMSDDLPATISEFLPHIGFVHFRDVQGTVEDFVETFHDQGPTDLVECMRRYVLGGYTGPMRPDHVPTLYGESNAKPGYATLGRLFAIGYLRGLIDAATAEQGRGRPDGASA